jgi:hypothetical protein
MTEVVVRLSLDLREVRNRPEGIADLRQKQEPVSPDLLIFVIDQDLFKKEIERPTQTRQGRHRRLELFLFDRRLGLWTDLG